MVNLEQNIKGFFTYLRSEPSLKKEAACAKLVEILKPFFMQAKKEALDETIRGQLEGLFVYEYNFVKDRVNHALAKASSERSGGGFKGGPNVPKLAGVTFSQEKIEVACIAVAVIRTVKQVFCQLTQKLQPTPFQARLLNPSDLIGSLEARVIECARSLEQAYAPLADQTKQQFADYVIVLEDVIKKYCV